MIIYVLLLCGLYYIWTLFDRRDTDPPELSKKFPLIGHSHMFIGNLNDFWNTIKSISEECLEKGGVLSCYVAFQTIYAITDPDDIITVANTCLEKHEFVNKFASPLVGEGLITGHLQTWKRHRKLINPAFHQHVLNSFVETFNSQARRLGVQLAGEVGNQIDHDKYFKLNNLETILMTSAGQSCEKFGNFKNEYTSLFREVLEILINRFRKVWLHKDFVFNLTTMKKRQDDIIRKLHTLTNEVIREKKAELKKSDSNREKVKLFMDLMMMTSFTDDEIREETTTIILAGHDTTAASMTILLTVLGSYPDVQEKIFQEMLQVIGSEKDVEKDDLPRLKYTDMVIKETLRLYPIVPAIARQIDEAVTLKNYTLRKNNSCVLFIYGVNRHPMWGPDADQFRPERWLDPVTLKCQKYFASFSLGKRSCIGKQFAMMSMKILLAHLVRRYRFKSDISNVKFKMDIMMQVDTGYHVTLESRK